MKSVGMYQWMCDLFPINRSLSGAGNRQTLGYLKAIEPKLMINEFPSGQKVFDWVTPSEWNVSEAFIETLDGNRIVDLEENNLHLVGYSVNVDKVFRKEELIKHIHYLPDQPTAIPYVTSYYVADWGFCMSYKQFQNLGSGPFRVKINSTFKSGNSGGSLTYGEVFLPGKSSQEVIFSTYICHPSMANNELSGPVIAIALARELQALENHYSYRFLFLPETIGAIAYISKNLLRMKQNVIAGWVLTCLGDSGDFSYVSSRYSNTYADKVTRYLLDRELPKHNIYSWLSRGSDERQYCAPGVDLPFCSLTRSKYGEYREYHTSLDNLNFVNPESLQQSLELLVKLTRVLESNRTPKSSFKCEPQMGKRGVYSTLSTSSSYSNDARQLLDVLSYSDGSNSLTEIAEICRLDTDTTAQHVARLENLGLISL